ncbi:MAG: hypothetical protein K2M97_01965, partial [Muribaculaceae bacterium]|nr:hypothetical protein [Muribaculaceae bacterium]
HHPSVYQANIPQPLMYSRAIDGFVDSFKGYTPVFLTATDISSDKSSFVETLQHRLDSLSVDFEEIEFTGEMAEVAIGEQLDANGRYVFVPASASREMLARILPALAGQRERALVPDDVRLFGYPEWIILRGEQSLKLHQLNTLIYSRFASDAESYPTRRLSSRYEEHFGSKMGNAVPVYGMLGFDAGCWMLGRGANYTGLQNSFTSGDVNTALYFINFAPDGTTNIRCAD